MRSTSYYYNGSEAVDSEREPGRRQTVKNRVMIQRKELVILVVFYTSGNPIFLKELARYKTAGLS
jgi:hypothetical protein